MSSGSAIFNRASSKFRATRFLGKARRGASSSKKCTFETNKTQSGFGSATAIFKNFIKTRTFPIRKGPNAGGTLDSYMFYIIPVMFDGNRDQSEKEQETSAYRKEDENTLVIRYENRATEKIEYETEFLLKTGRTYCVSTLDGTLFKGPNSVKPGDIIRVTGLIYSDAGKCKTEPLVGKFGEPITKKNEYLSAYGGEETVWRNDAYLNAKTAVKVDKFNINSHTKHSAILNGLGANKKPFLIVPNCVDEYFVRNDTCLFAPPFEADPTEGACVSFPILPMVCADYDNASKTTTYYTNKKGSVLDVISYVVRVHQSYEPISKDDPTARREGHVVSIKYTLYADAMAQFGMSRFETIQAILPHNRIPHSVLLTTNEKETYSLDSNGGNSTLEDMHPLPTTQEELDAEEELHMEPDFVAVGYVAGNVYPYLAMYLRDIRGVLIPYRMAEKLIKVHENGKIQNAPAEEETRFRNTLNDDPEKSVINLSEYSGDFRDVFVPEKYDFFIMRGRSTPKLDKLYEKEFTPENEDSLIDGIEMGDEHAQVYAVKKSFKNVIERYEDDAEFREKLKRDCKGLVIAPKVEKQEEPEAVETEKAMDVTAENTELGRKRPKEEIEVSTEMEGRKEARTELDPSSDEGEYDEYEE